jgi:hypothetical protein
MAEFFGYFSLVDNRGIDFLAILYRRENLSLAARKFNRVPSYVSNVLQDPHLSTLPMLIVEETVIDVNVEMIRFPVYVVLRKFFHSGGGNRIIFREGQTNVYGIAEGSIFEFGYWDFPCIESTPVYWNSNESFLTRWYTVRLQIEKISQDLFDNLRKSKGFTKVDVVCPISLHLWRIIFDTLLEAGLEPDETFSSIKHTVMMVNRVHRHSQSKKVISFQLCDPRPLKKIFGNNVSYINRFITFFLSY